MHTLRRHLTYANVMATIAVFIALGGSSYAVARLSGSSLKNRSVRAIKVARNTLTGREIRESRLGSVPNANRLGGLSADALRIRCPADTFPTADTCIERTSRSPAAYTNAVGACAREGTPRGPGRRLPTHGELTSIVGSTQVFTLAPGGELTGSAVALSSSPDGVGTLYVTDTVGSVGVTPDTGAGAKAFRCVTDPLN